MSDTPDGMIDYTREKTGRQVRLNRMIDRTGQKLTKKLRKFGYMGNLSVCYTPKSEEDRATNIVEPSQSDVIRWLMTDKIDTPESVMDQVENAGSEGRFWSTVNMLERYSNMLEKIEELSRPPMDAHGEKRNE